MVKTKSKPKPNQVSKPPNYGKKFSNAGAKQTTAGGQRPHSNSNGQVKVH